LDLSAAALGTILGIGGFFRFSGTMAAGLLADRVPRKMILVPGLIFQSFGVLVLNLSPSLAGFVLSVIATSFFSIGVALSAAMLGDLTAPHRIGRELGLYRFLGDVGLLAGPAISTLLIHFGRTDLANLVVAALLVASAILVALGVPETNRPRSLVEV
jgi:MFS family permease